MPEEVAEVAEASGTTEVVSRTREEVQVEVLRTTPMEDREEAEKTEVPAEVEAEAVRAEVVEAEMVRKTNQPNSMVQSATAARRPGIMHKRSRVAERSRTCCI